MSSKNPDLRVIKTKESIRLAFIELIEEKGFDALTVKDITTKAQINRGTFYVYFQDKFDLITQYENEVMENLYKIRNKNLNKSKDETTDFPTEGVVEIFSYLYEIRDLMKAFLTTKSESIFMVRMKEVLWNDWYKTNPDLIITQNNLLVPSEYYVAYFTSAIMGLIQQWFINDCKESPREMTKIIELFVTKGPLLVARHNSL